MPRLASAVKACLFVIAAASTAAAQTSTHFSLGAGASFPTGRFGDVHQTGYHILGAVDFDRPASALGFRIDGMFNEFELEGNLPGSTRVIGLNANAVVRSQKFGPYLIGGVGVYGSKYSEGGDSDSDVGFNIGGGFRFELSGFSAFLEARFHQVTENVRFIPVTFGVTF
jgi:hypothetical protein